MLRPIVSNEIFTILLVISFITVAIAKLTAPKRFDDFILILGNNKYLKIYSREQKFFDKFDALLFFNLIISVSVFFLIIYKLILDVPNFSIQTILKLATSLSIFTLIKVLMERLIGSLLEVDKLIDKYIFQKISFKNYLGLILLPINAVLVYSFTPTLTIIYVIISLVLIINTIGLISSFKTHQSLIKNHLFYFILYLCALEIAPYIILYKVFISK
ncbi:DUF4271 domain-containing protein [Algibacter pectinivorans]|uniref:DUF4271 domain-containing protein n=1 Tax=Algibacter pectinivorans TaxID=870482 RepID=A0A1I1MKZ5_9FLAO|nr:DUF4271 domain-containing protein [Algibacter pectinivorans]SFC86107.1 protein of unknown function [Algibacter pectinivorans]